MFNAFFRDLPRSVIACFRGRNLLVHALAITITAFLVLAGVDWAYFSMTRGDALQSFALPAAIIGFFVPIIVPVVLFVIGEIRSSRRLMTIASAVAQAELAVTVIVTFYKALTGRTQPEFFTHLVTTDYSRDFHFGFLLHGVFWGWPSMHAALACAMGAVIFVFCRSRALRVFLIVYALYMAVGVSISIHWLSDAIAGTLIGTMIGLTVGRRFQQMGADVHT